MLAVACSPIQYSLPGQQGLGPVYCYQTSRKEKTQTSVPSGHQRRLFGQFKLSPRHTVEEECVGPTASRQADETLPDEILHKMELNRIHVLADGMTCTLFSDVDNCYLD